MAVDIKQLRIGSHILVNDVRARIERLEMSRWPDGKSRPWGYFHGKVNGEYRECGSFLDVDNVQPIEITPELLSDLGFEWREDSFCWRQDIDKYWILVNDAGERGWRFSLYLSRTDWTHPVLYARHLHEIEGQLAYYGVELIGD